MDRWEPRYQALVAEITAELPGFRIVKKSEDRLQRAIHRALFLLTFGSQAAYLTQFTTTIGRTVYVTDGWATWEAAQRYVVMRHERVHLRQFQRYGLVGMALLYLFVPLPVGLAWFRTKFEKEGYAETIRAVTEVYGIQAVEAASHRDHVVKQFTSGNYGWMWPYRRQVERWYDAVVASLESA